MDDLDEHHIPPGGWQFYQPETKWRAPTPIASTLSQTVTLIIAMRRKNPAITAKFKLATNPEAVKIEVLRFNRKRLGIPEEGVQGSPFSENRRYSSHTGAGAAAGRGIIESMSGLKRAAQGTAVVLDWLMSGGAPVTQELADKRGAVCATCEKNIDGAWFTEAPATLIKNTLEARKDLKLETPYDAALKSCDVCKCLNRLKVWCPMEHILAKTRPEIFSEFPAYCWIAKRDQ